MLLAAGVVARPRSSPSRSRGSSRGRTSRRGAPGRPRRRAPARDPELRRRVLPPRLLRTAGLLADAARRRAFPEVEGYWGSLVALTLATYPYVFLLDAGGAAEPRPVLEEAARGLGESRGRVFVRVTAPALRPAVGLGALLVVLYTLSDFGVVSLMNYDTLTPAIYVQYRASSTARRRRRSRSSSSR